MLNCHRAASGQAQVLEILPPCSAVCAKSLQSCLTLCSPMHCGLWPTRLLCPWDSPGKNIGVGCHFLFQGIFLTQESNPHLLLLLHWQSGYLMPPLASLFSPSAPQNNVSILFIFLSSVLAPSRLSVNVFE